MIEMSRPALALLTKTILFSRFIHISSFQLSAQKPGSCAVVSCAGNNGAMSAAQLDIVDGDLLDQEVDVIVNAWNRNIIPWWLLLPQGVSGAIKKRAGYAPFRELGRKGPLPVGGAVLTGAGRLPHRGIIHVAGINMLWRSTERAIRGSVSSALRLAQEQGFRSIALPLIGAGTGGGRAEVVLTMMKEEVLRSDYDGRVVIVRYRKP